MDKYLKLLKAALQKFQLSENVINKLLDGFKGAATGIDNDDSLKALSDTFTETGKQLAEDIGNDDREINLSITAPGKTLSQDDIDKAIQKRFDDDAADKAAKASTLSERQTQFDNLMDAAFEEEKGSLRTLSEDQEKQVRDARSLITADMADAQVKTLAENQIAIGGQLVVAKKLSERGYKMPGVNGNVHIDVDQGNSINQYQQTIDQNLQSTMAYANGNLQFSENTHPFVDRVLAIFDQQHSRQLLSESRVMLGQGDGEVDMGNVELPLGLQRTVIRQALSDLRVLTLVNTLTDGGAQVTTQIPYEVRDISQIRNNGVVYEGQGIHRAGIEQKMDTAYISALKISMIVSNEVAHFSRSSAINWDAWGRNVETNARVMRELIVARICNELQRCSDSYKAGSISEETVSPNTTTRIFRTSQFPILRPLQIRDLQGAAVGNPQHPIVMTLGAVEMVEYDGSDSQPSGIYYRIVNFNLGLIQIVDENGAAVAPGAVVKCSYSYATNVAKVDTDLGDLKVGERWNDVLRIFGSRKAVMAQERYVLPNFALMAHTLNDQITNADNFVASNKKSGTDTNNDGDLATIKAVSAYSTNSPGIDLGEERILLGQRGTGSYVVAKPFRTGQPFEAINDAGLPTGQRQAYGEEYSAFHVPGPLRGYMTSLICYSKLGRDAI